MNWQVEQGGSVRGVWATRDEADAWCLRYEQEYRVRTCCIPNFGWQITETSAPVTDPPETPADFERRAMSRPKMGVDEELDEQRRRDVSRLLGL